MLVAEVGLNHLGDNSLLKKYIDAVRPCVDGISIQILSDEFFKNKVFSKFKLSKESIINFIKYSHDKGLKVGLVINDESIVDNFKSELVSFYKILSGDYNNINLFKEIAKTECDSIYISTGLSGYDELDKIIPILVKHDNRVKLIHTQLSNEIQDVNLMAIKKMRERFKLPVAYGHHCIHEEVLYTSVGMLPESIFFYIKGEEENNYPDKLHALSINKIQLVTENLKKVKISVGDGTKISMKNNLRKN